MTGTTTDQETETAMGAEPASDAQDSPGTGATVWLRSTAAAAWVAVRGLDWRVRAGIAALVIAVIAGGVWWHSQRDELPAGAAFRIGDTVVTADAVQQRIQTLKALYGVQVPTDPTKHDSFQRDAAKSMAVQIILQDQASKMGVTVSDRQVGATVGRLISQRYPDGGRTAFVAALGQLGANEGQVREEIRNQILVSALFDAVVKDIQVSDADVRSAFTSRRSQLGTPAQRDLRNIVVADRRTANQVRAQALAGTSFATLASRYSLDGSTRSHGGELGAVSAAELDGPYAKAAFSAPVGGVFGPVKNKYGWNVGLVVKAIPAKPAVFARVRSALKQTLVAERSVAQWRTWLGSVIAGAHVTYADAYRPADPNAVPDVNDPSGASAGAK